jgi:hypothetical protein
MATATTSRSPALNPLPFSNRIVPVNSAPMDFDSQRDLPAGFLELFDQELDRLLRATAKDNEPQIAATLCEARGISEEMIRRGEFNPV